MGGDRDVVLVRSSSSHNHKESLFALKKQIALSHKSYLPTGCLILSTRDAQVYSGAYKSFSAPLSLPPHRQTIPELPATTLPLFAAASEFIFVTAVGDQNKRANQLIKTKFEGMPLTCRSWR